MLLLVGLAKSVLISVIAGTATLNCTFRAPNETNHGNQTLRVRSVAYAPHGVYLVASRRHECSYASEKCGQITLQCTVCLVRVVPLMLVTCLALLLLQRCSHVALQFRPTRLPITCDSGWVFQNCFW